MKAIEQLAAEDGPAITVIDFGVNDTSGGHSWVRAQESLLSVMAKAKLAGFEVALTDPAVLTRLYRLAKKERAAAIRALAHSPT